MFGGKKTFQNSRHNSDGVIRGFFHNIENVATV